MTFKGKTFCFTVTFLLLTGMYACQNIQEEQDKNSQTKTLSGKTMDARIADLLTSMDMYRFSEPVKAPDFELSSLSGEKVSLSQYRGNVVLLSFWATW